MPDAMTDYGEFRLRVERGSRTGTYRVEASGLGGESRGRFRVPFSDTELENFILKVGRTRRGVRRIESPEMQAARAFGNELFSAVMEGKTGELYRAAMSEARATGQGLRVTLCLTDVPELGAIPWEFLYDPPNFLAISTQTPVVRYLDLPKPRRPLKIELPLRILGVASAPMGEEVLDAGLERTRLDDALARLKDANAVAIDWLEEPTPLALAKKLRSNKYHIIHFIGHGGFDASSGEGALLFEDNAGRSQVLSGDRLGGILHGKTALRLVVLNSCEGARNSLSDPFSGVATKLVQYEVPAVIGMQFEITDRAAILFAGEFYAMLAEGNPVDAALAEARLAIWADQNDVEWGTPVLFMRVGDGRLFEISNATVLPRVDPHDLPPALQPQVEAPDEDKELPEPEPEPTSKEPGPDVEPPVDAEPPVDVEPPPVEPPPIPTVADEDSEPLPTGIRLTGGAAPPAGPSATVLVPPMKPPETTPTSEPEPAEDATTKETSTTRPSRLIPWRKVAIAAVAAIALLVALRLVWPTQETGSVVVSTAGTFETQVVEVRGRGFAPGETIDILLDGRPATKATASGDGTFTTQLNIGSLTEGEIRAKGRQSGNEAGHPFVVEFASTGPSPDASAGPTDEATATTSPAAPTSPGILYWGTLELGATKAGDAELFFIDPATRVREQLTSNDVDDGFPTWSPDYKMIAFARGPNGARDIWYRDDDGEHQLTNGPSDDWYPTWSKDGWIAYCSKTSETASSIRAIRVDGSGDHEILSGKVLRMPAWSADGGALALADGDDLVTIRADGSGLVRLTEDAVPDRTPTWSNDGKTIAFVREVGGEGNAHQEIYLLDIASKRMKRLTNNEVQDGNPVWSPDGSQIAFYRTSDIGPANDKGFHLWVINVDRTGEHDLMPDAFGRNLDPNWR